MKKKAVKKTYKTVHPKKELLLKALKSSLGVVTEACKMAKIPRQNHYDWLENDPEYAKAVESIADESLDFAESKLFQLIKGVELPEDKFFVVGREVVTMRTTKRYPPDNASTMFYLKTKGKKRGYIERQEVTGKDGKDLAAFDWNNIFKKPDDIDLTCP